MQSKAVLQGGLLLFVQSSYFGKRSRWAVRLRLHAKGRAAQWIATSLAPAMGQRL